jgi:hypothetical protein
MTRHRDPTKKIRMDAVDMKKARPALDVVAKILGEQASVDFRGLHAAAAAPAMSPSTRRKFAVDSLYMCKCASHR